jgi:hypothetical protein
MEAEAGGDQFLHKSQSNCGLTYPQADSCCAEEGCETSSKGFNEVEHLSERIVGVPSL